MSPLLEMRSITKEYRGVAAVQDVSFTLENGEIHALVGENGAGKSTLTKIIAGAVAPTSGTMLLDGKPITFAVPKDALNAGVAMVYQENSLVPALTVAQNIFLGRERFFNRMRGINIAAQQFLQSLNFGVDPTASVGSLGAAQRQMAEIARAVRQQARVIIFDEPTASLTPEEKFHFFGLMKRLKQSGVSIIFISHALEEALQNADRITVLRDGQHVLTDSAANLDRGAVIRAMGRTQPVRRNLWRSCCEQNGPRARAQGAECAKPLHGIDGAQHVVFCVRRAGNRHVRPYRLGAHGNRRSRCAKRPRSASCTPRYIRGRRVGRAVILGPLCSAIRPRDPRSAAARILRRLLPARVRRLADTSDRSNSTIRQWPASRAWDCRA
jgi:ABC-type sugar transport system ATPase subunit